MSDLITTTQDTYRNACIEAFVGLTSYAQTIAERAKENRGQTAAEYMGVMLLVSIIIVAIVQAGVAGDIKDALKDAVSKISGASCGDKC